MKLKETFVVQEFDGEQIMVAVGGSAFAGFVRSNETAAFIVNCLKEETRRDAIVDAMCEKYDAPRETIAEGVDDVIAQLRSIGALDE